MNAKAASANEPETAPETCLWQAVIANTVNDWVRGPLRLRREAEHFLLHDSQDFPTVCRSAGMDPERLRAKLRKLKERMAAKPHKLPS